METTVNMPSPFFFPHSKRDSAESTNETDWEVVSGKELKWNLKMVLKNTNSITTQ